MTVIASVIDPGVQMDQVFVLPDTLLQMVTITQRQPNGSTYEKMIGARVDPEFIAWCDENLRGFVIFLNGNHRIRVCQEDYVLIKLKYFAKETAWQRIT